MAQKKENKKINEQVEIDYYKTKLGKCTFALGLIGFGFGIIGLVLAIFDAVAYFQKLNIESIDTLANLGSVAMMIGLIFMGIDSISHLRYRNKVDK